MAEVFEDLSPYNYAVNNPILMNDPDGMAAGTVHLSQVNIVGKQVLKPAEGVWENVFYFTFGREYDAPDGLTYPVSNDGRARMRMLTGTPPDLGTKAGINTIYKGIKAGLPYIGKSFNIFKRYTKAERLLLKIEPVLGDIKDAKLLRAIEQKILEYKKSMGAVANKIMLIVQVRRIMRNI